MLTKKMIAFAAAAALAACMALTACAGQAASSSAAASSAAASSAAASTPAASTSASAASTSAAASSAATPASSTAASASTPAASASAAATNNYIGDQAAIDIALKDAGFAASDVTQLEAELDLDDAVVHYDVNFKNGGMEYDYDIDATSGAILTSKSEVDD